MNGMTGNGYRYRPSRRLLIALVDGLLILVANLWALSSGVFSPGQALEVLAGLFVIQVIFYFFGLYDWRLLGSGKRSLLVLAGAQSVSILLLVLLSAFSFLSLRPAPAALAALWALLFLLPWRLLLARAVKNGAFQERILIIGTGELAQRIQREIMESGLNGRLEVVGFIKEDKREAGEDLGDQNRR